MARPDNKYQELAREAAERIDGNRALAEQLSLLPDERECGAPGAEDQGGSRRPRGPGRVQNQMREWLAARGFRLPEDVIAEMAGLTSREDAILSAMTKAEQILAWAQDGAAQVKGAPTGPTLRARLDLFQAIYAMQLRAAEALMPYGTPKAAPDVQVSQTVQVFQVPGGSVAAATDPGQGFDQARDVTPKPRRIAPPPLPGEIVENQRVARDAVSHDRPEDRTK